MTAYVNITFNHLAALQHWVTQTGGVATLDVRDLTLEVKHRGRYFRMYPTFQANVGGSLVHLPNLSPQAIGFGGWRPYTTFSHPHSTSKPLFKQFVREAGLRTPREWDAKMSPPECDYLLKPQTGSFGRHLFGPYRAHARPAASGPDLQDAGPLFAEEFIQGHALKVWFWGARPFFAHMQSYPTLQGDGASTLGELLDRRIAASVARDAAAQIAVATACLAFQGHALADVLPAGEHAWIDYRYGQQYVTGFGMTPISDNQLDALHERSGTQLAEMGRALAKLLQETIPVPVMITVDGILDAEGRIWWLEMNTNSLLPPEGYGAMFADLFA